MSNGKGTSKFSVIANVASISGFTVMTVLGAIRSGRVNLDNVFKVMIFGALCLAAAALVSAIFFAIAEKIRSAPHSNNGYKTSLIVALWLAFASGAALLGYWGLAQIESMPFIT